MNIHLKTILAMVTAFSVAMVPQSYAFAFGEAQVDEEYSVSLADSQTDTSYTQWLSSWNQTNYDSVTNVVLTPGSNLASLNFSWYAKTGTTPAVALSTKPDFSDARFFSGTSTVISRSTGTSTYSGAQHVSVQDALVPGKTYYYRVTNEQTSIVPVWSSAHTYTVPAKDNFTLLLAGDSQIGASGDVAADTYSWNKVLNTALKKVPNASFLLSLGDQVDYKTSTGDQGLREQQYAGFLYPGVLRSLPVATVIGNHDTKGPDYSYHFNNPNAQSGYGATPAGCDYYFSRGSALFIVLNSNNRNQASHRKLLKEAVAAYPDAKWRIVTFHHDIYGSGSLHSNRTSANTRIFLAPLMDEFKIDLVFSGHDHSYCRSYPMLDGTAFVSQNTTLTNPSGTVYLSLGSSSGSKMYNLAPSRQYYVSERSNDLTATFSSLTVSENTLTLKTYDIQGNTYANTFTLHKITAKDAPVTKYKKLASYKKKNYTTASYKKFHQALTAFEKSFAPVKTDAGIAKIQNGFRKSSDPLSYYGYRRGTTLVLPKGFSTLLDKTLYKGGCTITQTTFDRRYAQLKQAAGSLKKTSFKVTYKKKNYTEGKTLSLKKGQTVKLKLKKTPTRYPVTCKSSSKSCVTISRKGVIHVKKVRKKPVILTLRFQNRTLHIKVKIRK